MVKILHPIPKTCPSFLYSIADAATPLAKPVIGTSTPAPAKSAILQKRPKPVRMTLSRINISEHIVPDSSLLNPSAHHLLYSRKYSLQRYQPLCGVE